MEDLTVFKDYLIKLQKMIKYNTDFNLGDSKLIKKSKIDDLFCCVIASMPDVYKKYLRTDYDKRFSSINTFRLLDIELKHKFFLNPSFYIIKQSQCEKLISAVFESFENDIKRMLNSNQ